MDKKICKIGKRLKGKGHRNIRNQYPHKRVAQSL